ncbi:MAG: T9SS type A sorting domain-containing protein, partial [Schleiferiaceae bacterium]
ILNGVDIPGANSTTWYPTLNGMYSVRVTNASGCASESDVFNYLNIGTGEAELKAVSIYPNPTTGVATIELPEADALIRVYDGIGRLVLEGQCSDKKYLVDLTRFASGLYRVSVQWQDGTETISLIKN